MRDERPPAPGLRPRRPGRPGRVVDVVEDGFSSSSYSITSISSYSPSASSPVLTVEEPSGVDALVGVVPLVGKVGLEKLCLLKNGRFLVVVGREVVPLVEAGVDNLGFNLNLLPPLNLLLVVRGFSVVVVEVDGCCDSYSYSTSYSSSSAFNAEV